MNPILRPQQKSFRFFENEKSVVVTVPKNASRFTSYVYTNQDRDSQRQLLLNYKGEIAPYSESDDHSKKTYLDLIDIKKNKKDIYFLYRNPINRFASGIIQDLFRTIDRNNFNQRFEYSKNLNLDYHSLYQNILKQNYNIFLSEEYRPLFDAMLDDYLTWQQKTFPIISVHTQPYLEAMHSLVGKVDSKKAFLVNLDDTDNNLISILQPYFDETIHNVREKKEDSNSEMSKYVIKRINENPFHESVYANTVLTDAYFYTIFEESKLNIKNKK